MGYRDRLKNEPDKENDFLEAMLEMMREAKEKDWENLKIVTFTDSIFVGIDSTINGALRKLCHYASRLEELMLRKEALLLRGAICKGKAYFDENFAFGSGIVLAVTLESTIAFYPRIIIDKSILSESYIAQSKHTIWNLDSDFPIIDCLNYYHPDINKNGSRQTNSVKLAKSLEIAIARLDNSIKTAHFMLKKGLKKKRKWLLRWCGEESKRNSMKLVY